jgi:hypothetical protein
LELIDAVTENEEKTLSYIKQKESVRITFSDERKLIVDSVKDAEELVKVKDANMAILNLTQIVKFNDMGSS